ncbi:P-loop containing nucleoside triphosphate hydrolase protein [Abortiporus biennis]|nr:P-loop containing nucleoside triphosphate hydrolase protein [Abortiporus biennis]
MQVDEPVSKKEKKDKKRKREAEAEAEQEGPAEGSEEKKKKKKRKSEASPVDTPPTPESDSSSKKDRKKKSHTEAAATSASTSSAAQPTSDDVTAFLTKHSITINSDTPLIPIISFSQLQVPDTLRSAYKGFKEPTPIQACTWPPTLEGRDVVGIAETGSGKTLAFGLPALAQIASTSYTHTKPVALIVAPTRELAIQTHDTLVPLSKPFGIQSVAIFGGVDKAGQVKALQSSKKSSKGPTTRIVVGTPGRILDLIQDGILDLSEVHYLVLDEADRMLDKGFENDIRNIISRTKQGQGERQTLMFSATWPEAVRKLAGSFLRNPVRVTVGSDDLTANSRVEQILEVFDNNREKDSRLLGHLSKLMPRKGKAGASVDDPRILVFALYKKEAARLESTLRSRGYSVGGLHGDMAQRAREEALGKFKSGETPLLVATDVAARGLDIPNVAVVLNYTFPLTIEDYIHRIGRTGRGGKSGKSITFFTGDAHERSLAGELAKVLRESGFESEDLKNKFPMTIKKKTHSAYGAFFRDDIPTPTGPTKITFD